MGKTQLAMQLLFQVQLPVELGGLDGCGIYLNSESALPSSRLTQIMEAYKLKHPWTKSFEFRDSIFIEQLKDLDNQQEVIFEKLPQILAAQKNVKLLIIDSIAALLRVEYTNSSEDMKARSVFLANLSIHLKKLSDAYGMPVVVMNQVSDAFQDASDESYAKYQLSQTRISSGKAKIPALGLFWSHCINTRIFLTRYYAQDSGGLIIDFSPIK